MAANRERLNARELYTDLLSTTRDIRGFITHARKSRVSEDLIEHQVRLLCGKHAINHILQESKVVWHPEVEELYMPRGNPMERRIKINLADYCSTFFRIYKSERGIPPNAANPDCDLAQGNITSDLIQVFLQNELGYTIDALNWGAPNKAALLDTFRQKILPNCLGAIINIGGYHWTAISPNLNTCRKRVGQRLEQFQYAYIDSVGNPMYRCSDYPEALLVPLVKDVVQTIFVYYKPDSYHCVAVERSDLRIKHPRATAIIPGIYNVKIPPSLISTHNNNNNNNNNTNNRLASTRKNNGKNNGKKNNKKPSGKNNTKRNNNTASVHTYKPGGKNKKNNNNNNSSVVTYKP